MGKAATHSVRGAKKSRVTQEHTAEVVDSAAEPDNTSARKHLDAVAERHAAEAGGRPAGRGESDEQLDVRGGGNKRGREEILQILETRGRGGGHR